jgi:hypothetical protein
MNITMEALSKAVQTQTFLLLLAGSIMVVTLWVSKKARTVTETEISLGKQDEGPERFESIWLSRKIVTFFYHFFQLAYAPWCPPLCDVPLPPGSPPPPPTMPGLPEKNLPLT